MGRTERLAQPRQFGKYQLIARLAHGRLGDVYKAKSHGVEGFEKFFCVKVITPGLASNQRFVERLVEEAKRTVTLSHANVAQVYDLGQEEESKQFYVAMEYVNGYDLARCDQLTRLGTRSRSSEISLFVASEVAKGLDYAHRRKDYNFNNLNLVHSNLSPENVMVSFDGEVKITDFGLSRALEHVEAYENEDVIRRHLYVAPEVARGQAPTQSSDIYSLGLLMYEMLAGVHPYRHPDPDRVVESARNASVEPITNHVDLPRQLAKIVESALVPDPAGRANSAGSIYEGLVAYIFGNNLRADARNLAIYIQELRREEQRVAPEETTQELGMEEISLSELRVLNEQSDPSIELPEISDATEADLPSHKFRNLVTGGSPERPPLPGALEEYFNSARAGNGKAILVSGQFGSGRNYLPDRLVDALGWRGNTSAISLLTTPDDAYSPFGLLSSFILQALDTVEPAEALERLRELGLSQDAANTIGSVWGITSSPLAGTREKQSLLAEALEVVIDHLTEVGPLVIVIDRIERVDDVSLDVLRSVVGTIGKRSLMLVLCTQNAEQMRESFDLGSPEDLEAVHVAGEAPPDLDTLHDLPEAESALLAVISLAARPMTQFDLSQVLGISGTDLMNALRNLTDRGLVRVPTAGTFIAGIPELIHWVERAFSRAEIEKHAVALARYFTHRSPGVDVGRVSPSLVRYFAIAGERRQMLRQAGSYARWLEYEGWVETALDFYDHAASLIATHALGAPQARIDFLLTRAELALDLSRIDTCRATLEPIAALTETLRNERGAIRGQLLMGQMAMQQDDLVDALQHFRRATTAARAVNDPDLLAFSLLALARWHDRYGNPVAGQQKLDGAMNLYNRWGTYRMDIGTRALMLNRAVRMLARRGLLTRARRLQQDLRKLSDAAGLAIVACRSDWAESAIRAAEGDYDGAAKLLFEGATRAQQYELKAMQIELRRELAAVALQGERYQDVISTADELIVLAHRHQDTYSQQRAMDLRATASCILGEEVDASLAHLMDSLERARKRAVPMDIYRCHVNLERALSAVGREVDAEVHQISAQEIAKNLRYKAAA